MAQALEVLNAGGHRWTSATFISTPRGVNRGRLQGSVDVKPLDFEEPLPDPFTGEARLPGETMVTLHHRQVCGPPSRTVLVSLASCSSEERSPQRTAKQYIPLWATGHVTRHGSAQQLRCNFLASANYAPDALS